jgi:hypothetical protein
MIEVSLLPGEIDLKERSVRSSLDAARGEAGVPTLSVKYR